MRKLMSKFCRLSAGKIKVFSWGLLVFSVLAVNAHAANCTASGETASTCLGTASTFAVLGAADVTNTGATTLNGNLGVDPGTSITGNGSITLNGSIYTPTVGTTGYALGAQNAASAAFTALAGLAVTPTLTQTLADTLDGVTVAATGANTTAVYNFAAGAALLDVGQTLTLNFLGKSNENIVFVTGSTLIANGSSTVDVENAGSNDNVYWVVGSSATIGTGVSFVGNIIADQSVSMLTGATDGCGSVIALVGGVTLQGNTISTGCTMSSGSTPTPVTPTPITPGTGTTVTVPEGGSTLLYLCFSLLIIGAMQAFRFRRMSC